MSKNILLLHNGNTAVKEWFYQQYPGHIVMPCYMVDWPNLEESKNDFLNKNNVICDITSADNISYIELCKLKDTFHIVKVLSSYENDLANLEDTWNKDTYDYNQWLQANILRLCIADQVLSIDEVKIPAGKSEESVIFSPGRCGTHVLREVAGVPKFIHHNDSIVFNPRFDSLANSAQIYSILRRDFFNFAVSQFTIKATGKTIITRADNLEENQKVIKQFDPVEITEDEFVERIESVAAFLDILLALHFIWGKNISYSYYEDLAEHYSKIKVLKNPYTPNDIVKNYNEALILGRQYQIIYDQLLGLANSIFELAQF